MNKKAYSFTKSIALDLAKSVQVFKQVQQI